MLPYEIQREIELFVLREARLLDCGQFEAWLELYQTDPLNVASIVYEDHAILAIRVQRLLEARALVLTPMPRTTHLVSNIEVLESNADDYTVAAAFICVEHQGERQRMYSGRQTHQLSRRDGSFRIKLKRVNLINCDGTHSPIAIPL